MGETADVVVVGAGAVGSACAYYLADAGLKVVLVEREAVASGSSTHATGALSLLGNDFKDANHLRLGVESYRLARGLVPVLEELTGVKLFYLQAPFLRLALEPEEEDLIRSQMEWQRPLSPVQWIDGEEVRRIEPRLSVQIRGAAYQEESAQLDSGRFTLALATAAERCGTRLLLRRVTGLLRNGDRVVGVRYQGGEVSSPAVVLAMGPWAAMASRWLGFEVPVRPLKGESLLLRFGGPPLRVLLFSPKRGHMISRLDGLLSVGSTAGRDLDDQNRYLVNQTGEVDFDVDPTEEALRELLQRAIDVLPAAEEAELEQHRVGVRPLSPDTRPLIGPVPGCPGAYLATGHGTKGIHLAAVTGRLIADLVARGETGLPLSLGDFSPARFAGHGPSFGAAERSFED